MKNLLIYLSVIALFFGANAQNEKAAKYNNKLMKYQLATSIDISSFFHHIKHSKYEQIEAAHTKVDKSLDVLRAKVDKMGGFEGDNSLHDALNEWIKGYEESFDNEYKQMLPLFKNEKRSAEENAKLNKMHDELIAEEKVMDEKLVAAQKEFAKKYELIPAAGQ